MYGAMYCSGAGSEAEAIDDDGVFERARVAQLLDHRGHGRALLPDGDVDADDAGALLVDDGVDRDGGLPGAAVADDQLALAAADGDHGVDGLDAGLERLLDRLPDDDAGRHHLDLAGGRRLDRPPAVHRAAERVDHAAQHGGAGGHLEQPARPADLVALLQLEVVAEDRRTDVVLLQVEHQPRHGLAGFLRRELEHLARHRRLKAVDAGDAVADLQHGADLRHVGGRQVGGRDLAEQDVLELARTQNGIGGHVVCSLARRVRSGRKRL